MGWLEVVGVTDFFSHRKDLSIVEILQGLVIFVAHYFIYVLISYIFVDVRWEQLQWLHLKFHYT